MFYPALDVVGPDDEILQAVVDEFSPFAVEERDGALTLFFSTATDREQARLAILREFPNANATNREIDDEDWARRSQQNLQPVTIGRIVVAPQWATPDRQPPDSPRPPACSGETLASTLRPLTIVIEPSMGFGTGHHATTRLCLAALQTLDLADGFVLDVGTGSGVLALAARRLGARAALGIDTDPDAIRSAVDNLRINPGLTNVTFELADLTIRLASWEPCSRADVITANLTGALLICSGNLLIDSVRVGGHLILSGLLQAERVDVGVAFETRTEVVSATSEDEWVGLVLRRRL